MDQAQRSDHYLILDAVCHIYKHLMEHLEAFDEAVGPEWDSYRLVSECVNPAVNRFGRSIPQSRDAAALCESLLRRFKGTLDLELPDSPAVFEVFAAYREVVLNDNPFSPADNILADYAEVGEQLSKACYLQVCAADSPNLSHATKLHIDPRNTQCFKSRPNKQDGESLVIFEFATAKFTLGTFINLPFYFFHEYFSHIHSAKMYAEENASNAGFSLPFEDGWLLYAAHQFYDQQLAKSSSPLQSPYSRYSKHYAGKYIYEAKRHNPQVCLGYELAERFKDLAGVELFWQVTLQLAMTPYHHIQNCPDVHAEFLILVKSWLRHFGHLSAVERVEELEFLELALQEDDPVRALLKDVLT